MMECGVHILPVQQQQMSDVKLLSARLQTRRKMKETKRRKKSYVRRSRPDQETIFGYQTDDDLLSNYSSEGSTGLK